MINTTKKTSSTCIQYNNNIIYLVRYCKNTVLNDKIIRIISWMIKITKTISSTYISELIQSGEIDNEYADITRISEIKDIDNNNITCCNIYFECI